MQRDFNTAARVLLESLVSRSERQIGPVRLAINAVVESYGGDPDASASVLRQLLTPTEVQQHGFHQLITLADNVERLLIQDVELVLEIYRATFSWYETSREPTPMRGGVLALTSNRQQDYDGARQRLADQFPHVIAASPAAAVDVLTVAAANYLSRRDLTPGGPVRMRAGGSEIQLYSDHSVMWNQTGRPLEPEVEMLAAWQSALVSNGGDPEWDAAVITGLTSASPVPASLFSRLLAAVAAAPDKVAPLITDSLASASVLAESDTLVEYGAALVAVWPTLSESLRETIEGAILSLADEFAPAAPGVGERRRDRLLGLLPQDLLVSAPAQELSRRLHETADVRNNAPLFRTAEVGFRAVDEDESLRMRGIDPDLTDNRHALNLARALRDWHTTSTKSGEETRSIEALVDMLQQVSDVLPDLRASTELATELLQQVEGYLAQGGADLAQRMTADSPPEQIELVLKIADDAARHDLPDAATEDPIQWDQETPSWGWPAPRLDALRIYLAFSRYPQLASPQVLDGISAAAVDPSSVVRMSVAQFGWWAKDADYERVWGWTTDLVGQEQRAAVLQALLVSISHLYPYDADRAVGLVQRILERERADRASPHLLAAISGLLAEWWIYDGRTEGRALLDEIANELPQHLDEAGEIARRLRRAVTYSHADLERAARIRARGFALYEELVRVAADHFDGLMAGGGPDSELRASAQLLDLLAAEIYFSSGAYQNNEATTPQLGSDPARFYSEAAALLDEAVRIGIPRAADYLLQVLAYLVDVDPRGVIRRMDELLTAGERWGLSADSLAEGHFMPTVSYLLAAHRDLLMSDAATRTHLISALSTFSRAGFPTARRILYGLDDMFR